MEGDTVRGADNRRGTVQGAELVGAARARLALLDDASLDDEAGSDGSGDGRGPCGGETDPASALHVSPLVDTWRRVNRPPILVTIS